MVEEHRFPAVNRSYVMMTEKYTIKKSEPGKFEKNLRKMSWNNLLIPGAVLDFRSFKMYNLIKIAGGLPDAYKSEEI